MDLTPYLQSEPKSADEEPLLSVAINGSIALAMKGRFFLRCFCESFSERSRIGCAVTDEESCLSYLKKDSFEYFFARIYWKKAMALSWRVKPRSFNPV